MEYIYLYQIADTVFVKGSCTSLLSLERRIKNDYPKQRYKIFPVYNFHRSVADLRSWFDHRRCKDKEDKTTKFVLKIKSLSFEAVETKCKEISKNDRHNPNKKIKTDDKDDDKGDDKGEDKNSEDDDIYEFKVNECNTKKRKIITIDEDDDDDIYEFKKDEINDDNEEEIKEDDEISEFSESENVKFLKQRMYEGKLQILVASEASDISHTDYVKYCSQGYKKIFFHNVDNNRIKVYWFDSWINAEYLDYDPEILKDIPMEE